ncbi:MAG: TIR domain-containing protein [Alphaproteobacteria bacterium]|jgi:MinD-like ATPase involved in chromosome partitioning or flagellar assembly|nr:TIR domain-containing protein [Alphaproteobacteria bacterium]MBU1549662.1 TIR domain-containing protein [Alphaproteobacteria bacterium]MBU2336517.1 TIR domain-containing protein [Alphaproteobacteria bacterium]MBU2387602.1 TIR domain-containing protein [Alphaproteobacteria bacterium]
MAGSVVTFYSYKGGVGRSFALVNVAALLGRWGFRVLCIDWDLEAPGLENFFEPYRVRRAEDIDGGIVELLTDFAKTRRIPLEWRRYVQPLSDPVLRGVEFIKAGRLDADYMRRVQKLNWERLYKRGLGEALESMFEELREEYDFVLLDARTGVTDFSGIVTAQLPDILAFLFTANEQSLTGATSVAKRAAAIRNDIAIDRSRLMLLPIPARFESQVEHHISSEWRARFASTLEGYYDGWANKEVPVEKLVQTSTIPYVPFWSFGERIAVVEDSNFDSSSINFSMENIAALLAHRLGQTRLLIESRDEYVGAARRLVQSAGPSVFISHSSSPEESEIAQQMSAILAKNGITVTSTDLPVGVNFRGAVQDAISTATHFIMILGRDAVRSKFVVDDARSFLRQAASDETERVFLPLILPDVQVDQVPKFLNQFLLSRLENIEEASRDIVARIKPLKILPNDGSFLSILITADGDIPIVAAHVCALAENGTYVEATTDAAGAVSLKLLTGKTYKILAAHPEYSSHILEDFVADRPIKIRLRRFHKRGSIIIQSTGYIPNLTGRLNPIKDTLDRTYLYADNISINGGKRQPAEFLLNEPFTLEDSRGAFASIIVKLIEGRTTLIEYTVSAQ